MRIYVYIRICIRIICICICICICTYIYVYTYCIVIIHFINFSSPEFGHETSLFRCKFSPCFGSTTSHCIDDHDDYVSSHKWYLWIIQKRFEERVWSWITQAKSGMGEVRYVVTLTSNVFAGHIKRAPKSKSSSSHDDAASCLPIWSSAL